jgi:hypothetical protein
MLGGGFNVPPCWLLVAARQMEFPALPGRHTLPFPPGDVVKLLATLLLDVSIVGPPTHAVPLDQHHAIIVPPGLITGTNIPALTAAAGRFADWQFVFSPSVTGENIGGAPIPEFCAIAPE